MAFSNIFLQITTTNGPIIGEAQATVPFLGQIEVIDFKWGMTAHKNAEAKGGFGLSLSGAASSFLGTGGNEVQVNLGQLWVKKRVDVASARIMSALDSHDKIVMASITILNIQNLVGPLRDPGFNLTVTDAYFSDVTVQVESSERGAELMEEVTINYKEVAMTYMKKIESVNAHVPTVPFFFKKK